MKTRSDQNNPEQKTKNGINSNDVEFGKDFDPVKKSKQNYLKKGQPVKSKQRPE